MQAGGHRFDPGILHQKYEKYRYRFYPVRVMNIEFIEKFEKHLTSKISD